MFDIHSKESSFYYNKNISIFLKYCSEFFKDIENYVPKSELSAFFCLLLYFIQIMSFVIEPYLDDLEKTPTIFLFNALYFTNFVNFFKLSIFYNVKIAIFAFISAVNFLLLIYFLLVAVFLRIKIGRNFKLSILNSIISRICFFYYWIYFIPALEIFLNYFACKTSDAEPVCFQNNNILFAFGMISFILTIFFGMIFSYCNSDYAFIDTHRLKTSFNINFELANLMRIAIIIVKRITSNDNKWIFFLIAFLFLFFTFAFYFQTHPFCNKKMQNFFLGTMFSCFFLLIIISLWQVDLIREIDILFVYLPITILAFKISSKVNQYFYNMKFILQNENFNVFSGEEIYQMHNVENYSKTALVLGFFRSHFKVCNISKCRKNQKEEALMNLEKFISLHIQAEIEKIKKKKKSSNDYDKEYLILKYLSFLIDFEQNFVKAHFEVQSNIEKNESFSIFFHIVLSYLKNKIKNKIKHSLKTSSFSNSSSSPENDKGFYQFFKAFKVKKEIEVEIVSLLKLKNEFFDSFLKGNNGLIDLLSNSAKLIPKIEKFKQKIISLKRQKTTIYTVITMKFESLLNCLIFNNLWEGMKEEQELWVNIGRDSGLKSLHNSEFNFLDRNFIVVEVQFADYNGTLKDISFSEKFRNFFHYKKENKTPKDLLNYMPSFIAEIHPQIIQDFLTTKTKNSSHKELKIQSYAKDIDGFIFPISSKFGYNLDWHNQFVMYAALKKSKNTSEKIFLCNHNGEIQNVSISAYEELKKEYEFLKKEDIEMLNIYSFIPKLEKIIHQMIQNEGRNLKDKNMRNLFSTLCFPLNLERNLKFSRNQKFKKEESESAAETLHSKTDKRIRKKFYNHKYENVHIKDSTSNLKTRSNQSKEDFLNEENSQRTANITFNLSFFKHSYGEKEKHNLEYFSIHIVKFKKNKISEKLEVVPIEDTAQINESGNRDELKIPFENFKILNLFTRDQFPETAFHEQYEEKRDQIPETVVHNQTNEKDSKYMKENTSDLINQIENKKILKFYNDKDLSNSGAKIKHDYNKKDSLKQLTEFKPDAIQNRSQISSTNSSSNKVLLIYQSMTDLENLKPLPLKQIAFLNVFQMILAISFFIFVYYIINQYITKFYKPFEVGMNNFSNMYSSLGNSLLVNIELEYYYKNFTPKDANVEWNKLLDKILSASVARIYQNKEYFLNVEADLSFQLKIKQLSLSNIDSMDFKIKNMLYLDFIERSLNKLNENFDYLKYGSKNKIEDIAYDRLMYLQRNFPYFLLASSNYYVAIQNEFMNSDDLIYADMVIIFICVIILSTSIKCVEFIFWYKYNSLLNELMIILLRSNESEILKCIDIINQAIKHLDNSETYFFKNYGEQIMQGNKTKNFESSQLTTSAKKVKIEKKVLKKKNKKNFAYFFQYFFIFAMLGFIIFYYLFFFLKWTANNEQLSRLIDLDSSFYNLNVYSTSAICLFNLAVRENIISNSNYEASNETYQTKNGRLNFFQTALQKRLYILGNLTTFTLVPSFLEAKEKLNNPKFDKILNANICEVLIEKLEFEENSFEHRKCERLINGALKSGLANAENELIKTLKIDELFLLEKKSNEDLNAFKEKLINVIYQESFHDYIFANYYLGIIQQIFFKELSDYYQSQLDDLIFEFNNDLFIFLFFMILILFSFIYFVLLHLGRSFKSLASLISMIPYERLMNDEQMGFLIKNFLKNHG